jgi:hypothetical protein
MLCAIHPQVFSLHPLLEEQRCCAVTPFLSPHSFLEYCFCCLSRCVTLSIDLVIDK